MGQSGPGSDGNEGVTTRSPKQHQMQFSVLLKTLLEGSSYLFLEEQPAYSTKPVDRWLKINEIIAFIFVTNTQTVLG